MQNWRRRGERQREKHMMMIIQITTRSYSSRPNLEDTLKSTSCQMDSKIWLCVKALIFFCHTSIFYPFRSSLRSPSLLLTVSLKRSYYVYSFYYTSYNDLINPPYQITINICQGHFVVLIQGMIRCRVNTRYYQPRFPIASCSYTGSSRIIENSNQIYPCTSSISLTWEMLQWSFVL